MTFLHPFQTSWRGEEAGSPVPKTHPAAPHTVPICGRLKAGAQGPPAGGHSKGQGRNACANRDTTAISSPLLSSPYQDQAAQRTNDT